MYVCIVLNMFILRCEFLMFKIWGSHGGDYEQYYLLHMTPGSMAKFTEVSEEHTAFIFRVKE
jgi:hypothetical protein